jgi:hypothetical protein
MGNVIIGGASIGPTEHKDIDVHTKFMACLGRVLKPFNRWRQRPTGFHKDGTQVDEEAGLQVAHAGQLDGQQGVIVIVIAGLQVAVVCTDLLRRCRMLTVVNYQF